MQWVGDFIVSFIYEPHKEMSGIKEQNKNILNELNISEIIYLLHFCPAQ